MIFLSFAIVCSIKSISEVPSAFVEGPFEETAVIISIEDVFSLNSFYEKIKKGETPSNRVQDWLEIISLQSGNSDRSIFTMLYRFVRPHPVVVYNSEQNSKQITKDSDRNPPHKDSIVKDLPETFRKFAISFFTNRHMAYAQSMGRYIALLIELVGHDYDQMEKILDYILNQVTVNFFTVDWQGLKQIAAKTLAILEKNCLELFQIVKPPMAEEFYHLLLGSVSTLWSEDPKKQFLEPTLKIWDLLMVKKNEAIPAISAAFFILSSEAFEKTLDDQVSNIRAHHVTAYGKSLNFWMQPDKIHHVIEIASEILDNEHFKIKARLCLNKMQKRKDKFSQAYHKCPNETTEIVNFLSEKYEHFDSLVNQPEISEDRITEICFFANDYDVGDQYCLETK